VRAWILSTVNSRWRHLIYTIVRFSRLLWQSYGGPVALCRRDLNSTCWLMLLPHVRELFLAKRRQLNVITCRSTRTVNTSCSVYTLASSQCLIQDVRETTNYVVRCTNEPTVTNDFWRNVFLYDYDYTTHVCESVGAWPRRRSTWQSVPRQPSDYHRLPPDFRLPARGKRVQRQPLDYRLPSVVVFRPPYSGFHLASPIGYRTVACYVFVCCCAFMF